MTKIRKNPEKIRKPDEIPGKKIIISNLRSKTSNLGRNIIKTAEILRFEKCLKEKLRKKLKN